MSSKLIRELKRKEEKNELDWTLLNYHSILVLIEGVMIDESKHHLSSEEAVKEIRKVLQENWSRNYKNSCCLSLF